MVDLFVTYDQALLLKDLGYVEYSWFGSECSLYKKDGKHTFYMNGVGDETYTIAPLKSQVFQWFRDTHKIFPEILTDCTTEPKFCYTYTRFFGNPNDLASEEWGWENTIGQYSLLYRTYPEAESECIDKLIEIIRSEQK